MARGGLRMLEVEWNALAGKDCRRAKDQVWGSALRGWLVRLNAFAEWEAEVIEEREASARQEKADRRPQEVSLLVARINAMLRAYNKPDQEKPRAPLSDAEQRCVKRISAKSVFKYRLADVLAIVTYEKRRGRSLKEVYEALKGRGVVDTVFDDAVARNAILVTRKLDLSVGAMVEKMFHAV